MEDVPKKPLCGTSDERQQNGESQARTQLSIGNYVNTVATQISYTTTCILASIVSNRLQIDLSHYTPTQILLKPNFENIQRFRNFTKGS
ncbi:hypothetical protein NTGHW29_210006 [Candidatus Nitrotoga sp. HW29]|nr:hypothetical protein NTGHW29_210006 [Candidatus Nitrotoga sp. HW29]